MQEELRFCWGEVYCVREALKHHYKNRGLYIDIDKAGYSPDEGDKELVELTRAYLKETTGINYRYIMMTHGTTGAINVVLRTLAREEGRNICYTHKYHFPYYPHMIKKNGYKHATGLYRDHKEQLKYSNTVGLVDSPSNPEGNLLLYSDVGNNIIWDSVYYNPVFINSIPVKPDHRVNCGSYSKVFGLTGARVGWIATNNENDYNNFMYEHLYENSTMSFVSQELIKDVLKRTDLDNFMRSAKYRINNNREMFERIEYLFDGQIVPENGMFYVAWTTPHTQNLLEKIGIKCIELDQEGKDKYLRFNLAQTNEITKKAVKYLLKEDKNN